MENVLNQAIKINVTDGILKKTTVSVNQPTKEITNSSVLNHENGIKTFDNEIMSDSESEPDIDTCNIKLKKKYLASSNSSINDSIASALSTSNLTVTLSFIFLIFILIKKFFFFRI